MYADDTQVYQSTDPSQLSALVKSVEHCIHDISTWMLSNKLKLNND